MDETQTLDIIRERISQLKWDVRFIDIAKQISQWSSCIRDNRQVGAVIVRDRHILTTGYNGTPSGVTSCVERNECIRDTQHIESGTRQELCLAIHAEQNAILQAAKLGVSIEGATLYCTHQPCSICAKQIINAGIKRIVYVNDYPDDFALQLFNAANVKIEKFIYVYCYTDEISKETLK